MNLPEIRIYFSWLLYDNVSVHLDKIFATSDDKIVSQERCEEFVQNYRLEWAKYERHILSGLTGASGVNYKQSIIDVPCAPWLRSQSDPLLMGFRNFPDQFVDVLAHELCHVLLTDNRVYSIKSSEPEINLKDRWAKLFGDIHEFNTLVHIPVHALSKYLYLDILNEPSRLQRDINDTANNPPYRKAWEYVNSHDYKHIIEQLRRDYRDLGAIIKT